MKTVLDMKMLGDIETITGELQIEHGDFVKVTMIRKILLELLQPYRN